MYMYKNEKCWARSRGDCCEKISGEHIISRPILTNYDYKPIKVFVNGVVKFSTVRKNFTSNILCKTHNQNISPLDAEAVRLYRGLQEFHFSKSKDLYEVNIDGIVFERWLLKSLINSIVSGILDAGESKKYKNAIVQDELVACVFGEKVLPENAGAYIVKSYDWRPEYDYRFFPLRQKKGNTIIGMVFRFGPLKFLLWLPSVQMPDDVGNLDVLKGNEFYKFPSSLLLKKENHKELVLSIR